MGNLKFKVAEALSAYESRSASHLDDLKNLARIPSVSFPGFDPQEVVRSAEYVKELAEKRGLQNVQILKMDGVHPYVYGEIIRDPALPTLLLYAHHDVQPAGDLALWNTEPFEPTEVDGRLFGRGAADDKAGVLVHLASIDAWLQGVGSLPVNVKLIVEGEEEIGSEHLAQFLNTHKEMLQADCMVLTDTTNFDTGVPSLTISLRGIVVLDVEVESIDHAVHSGMWGGPIPCAVMALNKILASLVDDKGEIAVDELNALVPELSAARRADAAELPAGSEAFRRQSGMLDGVGQLMDDINPFAATWWKPSLAINAMQASSRKDARNILVPKAWARVGLRTTPGMSSAAAAEVLTRAIKDAAPWNVKVTVTTEGVGDGWSTSTEHPAFAAGKRALEAGYGAPAVFMGCGGSIPFVEPFARELGGIPALLVGVEDPYTNAHGENESLDLGDFDKAIKSNIHLFAELAETLG
jgi:acetylornithine deacetylase/succinyl-diaminopimelate desuccinylase-like protein